MGKRVKGDSVTEGLNFRFFLFRKNEANERDIESG